MNLFKHIIILFIVFTSLNVQAQDSRALTELDLTFDKAFYEGKKQKILGNFDEAIRYFLECIKIDPKNACIANELATIYDYQGNIDNAIVFSKRAVKLNKNNIWYKQILAHAYKRKGMFNQAAKVYTAVLKSDPYNRDVYIELGALYSALGKIKKAIKVYDAMELAFGASEEVLLTKNDLYLVMHKPKKVYKTLHTLIEENPKEAKYYGMLADVYLRNKQYEEAFNQYEKILKIDKNNGLVHISLANYYIQKQVPDKAFQEFKLAFLSNNVDVDLKIKILLALIASERNDPKLKEQSNELLQILLEKHDENSKVHTMSSDILVREKKYDEARSELRLVTQKDKNIYIVWQQLLYLNGELNDYESMYTDSKEAIEYFPNQPLLFLFNGISANHLEKYSDAISSLSEGVLLTENDNNMKVQFYSTLAETYNNDSLYKQSDSTYSLLLEIDPQNVIALNNYSYYLSLRKDSLDKAELMSKKCVDMNPKDPTYLDTYAWVLYKNGKYIEAKFAIEKAIRYGGDESAIIVEHYGDILYKNKEHEKAIELWNTANEIGEGSEFLLKKIEEKRLIE